MNSNSSVMRWVILGVLILLALWIVRFVLNIITSLVPTLIGIAIIVGIVWLVYNAMSKKKAY